MLLIFSANFIYLNKAQIRFVEVFNIHSHARTQVQCQIHELRCQFAVDFSNTMICIKADYCTDGSERIEIANHRFGANFLLGDK